MCSTFKAPKVICHRKKSLKYFDRYVGKNHKELITDMINFNLDNVPALLNIDHSPSITQAPLYIDTYCQWPMYTQLWCQCQCIIGICHKKNLSSNFIGLWLNKSNCIHLKHVNAQYLSNQLEYGILPLLTQVWTLPLIDDHPHPYTCCQWHFVSPHP